MLLNSNQIWKSSGGRLPLCELQVNCMLNHVMGIYTARYLDFIHMLRVCFLVWQITSVSLSLQLFRRVAAALPGMDTTQDKSREDSILCVHISVSDMTDCNVSWLLSSGYQLYVAVYLTQSSCQSASPNPTPHTLPGH